MTRPKISIANLLLVILVIALGLAAIKSGSPGWAGGLLSLAFFALFASLMAVVLTRGPRRIYWIGFAFLGWMYVLLTLHPTLNERVGSNLLAPCLYEPLQQWLHPDGNGSNAATGPGTAQFLVTYGSPSGFRNMAMPSGVGGMGSLGGAMMGGGMGGGGALGMGGAQIPYLQILWALEALIWAYLGGWSARYFASGRREERGRSPRPVAVPDVPEEIRPPATT